MLLELKVSQAFFAGEVDSEENDYEETLDPYIWSPTSKCHGINGIRTDVIIWPESASALEWYLAGNG